MTNLAIIKTRYVLYFGLKINDYDILTAWQDIGVYLLSHAASEISSTNNLFKNARPIFFKNE